MSFQLCALNFELVQRTLALSFQLAPPVPCLPSFQLRAFSFQLAQGALATNSYFLSALLALLNFSQKTSAADLTGELSALGWAFSALASKHPSLFL